MANYSTHRNIGILASVGSTVGLYISAPIIITTIASVINYDVTMTFSITTLILMVLFGVVGSIFPDIDLKTSTPSKYMRMLLMVVITFFAFTTFVQYQTQILDLIKIESDYIIIILSFTAILVSVTVIKIFENIMVHRGVVHSIPFAIVASIILFEGLMMINNTYSFINIDSLMIAMIFFVGFLTHLILDETFSVDLLGVRLKNSFGTALKFVDKKNVIGTIILYIMIGGYYIY